MKINKKLIGIIFISTFTIVTYVGYIQYKQVQAGLKAQKYVYPCGNLIGVKADTKGVLVLGYEDNTKEYIGGIQEGDSIIAINEEKVENASDIYNYIENLNDEYVYLKILRDENEMNVKVKTKNDGYNKKLGLWVRDKISGIGTMTFYDPDKEQFKAIGHPITDMDTDKLLKIKKGDVYLPTEINLDKATENNIGRFKCDLLSYNIIGSFDENTEEGISGDINKDINQRLPLIEVGRREEIKNGKACILFEDEKGYISSYDINIEKINEKEGDKNLVIEVIDDNLIKYTGGIVQGMSGAPIIQNNKLIGALTHVFRDNAKKGYGIFIDEMIELDKRN